jgi:large subunit ribosomal protein L13
MKHTQTTTPVRGSEIVRVWHVIDLKGKILGREANAISSILQGKHKVNYVPHLDMGDYVVVLNAKDVKVTGRKDTQKVYTSYSGYPGGLTEMPYKELMAKRPTEIIRRAVAGMLPKNKLRDRRLARLFISVDEKNPHASKVEGSNPSAVAVAQES